MRKPLLALAVPLLAVLVTGCEYRPLHLGGDGPVAKVAPGTDGPTAGTTPGAGPGRRDGCNPVAQDCPGGGRCSPDCNREAFVCATPHGEAKGRQGSVCAHDEDCAVGLVCFTQLGAGTSAPRCSRYCQDSRDCSGGSRCMNLPLRCDPSDDRRTLTRRLCVS